MFGIDDMAAASLISTGANVLGGIFGKKGPSLKSLNKQAEVQYNWQRKLNQTALQDRVSDATKAGIHPLYAIGGNVNPGGISMPSGDGQSDYDRFSGMGQSIERAVTAYATREERDVMKKSTMLDLERKQLENEVIRNQAAGSRMALQEQAGQPPANQSVIYKPNELAIHENNMGKEGGTVSGWTEVKNRDGSVTVLPSKDFQDRGEDIPFVGWEWLYKNKFIPFYKSLGVKNSELSPRSKRQIESLFGKGGGKK